MVSNHKEIDFEIARLQNHLAEAIKANRELVASLRALQAECVINDASSVIDSDAFFESRALVHKLTIGRG